MLRTLLTLLLAIIFNSSIAQVNIWVLDAFDAIAEQPVYLMSDEIDSQVPEGGHLQGIQAVGKRVFISGSSSAKGYLAIFGGDGTKLNFLGIKN